MTIARFSRSGGNLGVMTKRETIEEIKNMLQSMGANVETFKVHGSKDFTVKGNWAGGEEVTIGESNDLITIESNSNARLSEVIGEFVDKFSVSLLNRDELAEVLNLQTGDMVGSMPGGEDELVRPGVTSEPSGKRITQVDEDFEQRVKGTEGLDEVHKPFSHGEAEYFDPNDRGFDPSHSRCKDCAHYDNHGNCAIVPDIEPDGYCENFFADVGLFGHRHGDNVELNLTVWGDVFDWTMSHIDNFAEKVESKLRERT